MKQMIKRKDGSYSQKGLWDNIRANKGSGKKATTDMLEQADKIKKKEKMNSKSKSKSKKMGGGYKAPKYQMGGDMIEPSKEINFDRPMMRNGGEKPTRSQRIAERAEKKMTKAKQSWTKAEQARIDSESNKGVNSPLAPPTGNLERYADRLYGKAARQEERAKKLKEKSERIKEVEEVKKFGGLKKK